MTECLPSMYKPLSSIPNTIKSGGEGRQVRQNDREKITKIIQEKNPIIEGHELLE